MKITFLGGGNMACALISGLLKQGYTVDQIDVVEINEAARTKIKTMFGIMASAELVDGVLPCKRDDQHIVVLAVKPQQLPELTQQLAGLLDQHLVMSIAAGYSYDRLDTVVRWLPTGYSYNAKYPFIGWCRLSRAICGIRC